jgi:hypothetical protein
MNAVHCTLVLPLSAREYGSHIAQRLSAAHHIDKGVGAAKPSLPTRSEAGLDVAMADTMVSIDTIVQ